MKIAEARIHLTPTQSGGKRPSIGPEADYSCPVFFQSLPGLGSHGYDCRLLLHRAGLTIGLGETAEDVPIAFLSPDEVFAHIAIGSRFVLWESGPIGEGEITRLPGAP